MPVSIIALLLTLTAFVATADPAAAGGKHRMTLAPVDGGSDYYARFHNELPASASYFPIGVWFESVVSQADVNQDRAAGLNLYVVLTANSNLSLVQANGMRTLLQQDEWRNNAPARASPAASGWVLGDEIDMQLSPAAGYASLNQILGSLPADRRLRYSNYGKGVSFWLTDAEAARYVNDFQNVVSDDNYWFTDENICAGTEGGQLIAGGADLSPAECHRAANYGATVRRLRALESPAASKPVWAVVELGHPASEDDWPTITPAQVRAAVWQSLIAGARGIVYFNHSFGGPHQTQHILRDGTAAGSPYAPIRSVVTATDRQIEGLARVLNSPTVTSGWSQGSGTTAMAKWEAAKTSGKKRCKSKKGKCKKKSGKRRLYVFAGSAGGQVEGRFRVPCVGDTRASVVDEHRTVPVRNGSFRDNFADGNAIHIYRIDRGSRCGSARLAAAPQAPSPVVRAPATSAEEVPWVTIVIIAAVAGVLVGGFVRWGVTRRRMRRPSRARRAQHLGAR